jgi:hypothetical protein
MKNRIISILLLGGLAPTAVQAANNEISGFRYQECEASRCVVVESPKAWLSIASGSFVAGSSSSSRVRNAAKFQLLVNGAVAQEFFGDEIVSQPQISTLTIESAKSVVIVDTRTGKFESVEKPNTAGGKP